MKIIQDIWHGKSEDLAQRFYARKNIKTILTDPPFGVDNQSNMAVTEEGKRRARKIANDESPEIAIECFTRVMNAFMPAMQADSDIYIFTSYQVLDVWMPFTKGLLEAYGYKRKALLVWKKEGPGMGDVDTCWGMGCEFILYYKRGSWTNPGRRRNSVIEYSQLRPSELIHPHEKPEGLLELLAKQSTVEGELLVDPFGGSGSLVRAMRNINRSAVSIELDEYNYKEAQAKFQVASSALF